MTYKERVQRYKQRLLGRALRMAGGNVAIAAKLLFMDRAVFYSAIKRYGPGLPVRDVLREPRARMRELAPLLQCEPPAKSEARPKKQYFGVDVLP